MQLQFVGQKGHFTCYHGVMFTKKCPHCGVKLGNFLYADACPHCDEVLKHNLPMHVSAHVKVTTPQPWLVRAFFSIVRFVES